jgi:hypothetical protein
MEGGQCGTETLPPPSSRRSVKPHFTSEEGDTHVGRQLHTQEASHEHVRPWSTGSRFWRAGGEWFSFNRKSLWVAGQQGMSPAFRWPSLTDRRIPDRFKRAGPGEITQCLAQIGAVTPASQS